MILCPKTTSRMASALRFTILPSWRSAFSGVKTACFGLAGQLPAAAEGDRSRKRVTGGIVQSFLFPGRDKAGANHWRRRGAGEAALLRCPEKRRRGRERFRGAASQKTEASYGTGRVALPAGDGTGAASCSDPGRRAGSNAGRRGLSPWPGPVPKPAARRTFARALIPASSGN